MAFLGIALAHHSLLDPDTLVIKNIDHALDADLSTAYSLLGGFFVRTVLRRLSKLVKASDVADVPVRGV